MKKQIFLAAAFIAAMGITGLHAQQAAGKTAGYDLKKGVKCRISSTPTGCDIIFENEIKSPRDAASGQATGKRQHKPFMFTVSASDNVATEITSPRDIASGQASGKRTAGGMSKGFYQWIQPSWDKKMAVKKIPFEEGDEIILPVDSPDGEYELVLSWSWGASNSATEKRTYTGGRFILEIQGGELHAINSKGTGASNK
ncbi:MAG: hypothetical protein ABJB11_21600 [Ferruginibacter sp.]